jgi:hypothetical protein
LWEGGVRKAAIVALALLGSLSGSYAQNFSMAGNDTGGTIAWSRDAELAARQMTDDYCAWYGKYARVTGVNRQYGGYISFNCLWHPDVARYQLPEVRVAQPICHAAWEWEDGRRQRITVCE